MRQEEEFREDGRVAATGCFLVILMAGLIVSVVITLL